MLPVLRQKNLVDAGTIIQVPGSVQAPVVEVAGNHQWLIAWNSGIGEAKPVNLKSNLP